MLLRQLSYALKTQNKTPRVHHFVSNFLIVFDTTCYIDDRSFKKYVVNYYRKMRAGLFYFNAFSKGVRVSS